jgi:steroid delta-isomerase-like uncharacterized protein
MSAEQNKAVVRRFIDEVISGGNVDLIDELVAPDYVYHGPGMEVPGPEGLKQVFTMLRTAFPDWSESVEELIAEGDRVVFRVTGRGTHRGDFMGVPPTGKAVTMPGIDIVRIVDGRLAEHWAQFDQIGMMRQLGVMPAPAA